MKQNAMNSISVAVQWNLGLSSALNSFWNESLKWAKHVDSWAVCLFSTFWWKKKKKVKTYFYDYCFGITICTHTFWLLLLLLAFRSLYFLWFNNRNVFSTITVWSICTSTIVFIKRTCLWLEFGWFYGPTRANHHHSLCTVIMYTQKKRMRALWSLWRQ